MWFFITMFICNLLIPLIMIIGGYATEAVTAVVGWTLVQNTISCVTAEVDRKNIAFVRTLEKSGFELTGRIGEEGSIYSKVK